MEKTRLDVQGMTCGSCARHVREAVADVAGVQEVDVRLDEACVLVLHDPDVDAAALVRAVEGAGYGARLVA